MTIKISKQPQKSVKMNKYDYLKNYNECWKIFFFFWFPLYLLWSKYLGSVMRKKSHKQTEMFERGYAYIFILISKLKKAKRIFVFKKSEKLVNWKYYSRSHYAIVYLLLLPLISFSFLHFFSIFFSW